MNKETVTQQNTFNDLPAVAHGLDHFAEEALAKYKTLFDSNMFGIAATDFQDRILSANDAFLAMIGYSQEDLKQGKLKWSTISPSKYNDTDIEKIEELFVHKTIVPFEKEYIHKDGHVVPVLVGAEAYDEGATIGICFALDISELKELERKKDDFIGMVSHELKTPLSIMKLYVDFIEKAIEDGASKEELRESANEIGNQVDKLNILITDLLNMARYRSDATAFPVTAIDVCDCAKRVISELSLLHDRSIVFQGEKSVYINGNQERLSQVITNLVNNGIRYSNADSNIIVRVFKNHEHAYIQVQDFGMGISPENIDKIFERYYRINHADDYADKGAGIGLYVCNEIAKYHKGRIEVESILGKGSTFSIVLPLIKSK